MAIATSCHPMHKDFGLKPKVAAMDLVQLQECYGDLCQNFK